MMNNTITSTASFHESWRLNKLLLYQFKIHFSFCMLLLSGCAIGPAVTVRPEIDVKTLKGQRVKITRIDLSSGLTYAQVSSKSIWALKHTGIFSINIAQIDPITYKINEYPIPWSFSGISLLVDGTDLWYSNLDSETDLFRINSGSNQVISTFKAAGVPFALGDGKVWAYNSQAEIITGIDMKREQILTQFHARKVVNNIEGKMGEAGFVFAAGSIWQFGYERDFSVFNLSACLTPYGFVLGFCKFPSAFVRRIDPMTHKIIAEIPIGPFFPSDSIRFSAGAIWVLGWGPSESGNALAARINIETNSVEAKIQLSSQNCIGITKFYNPRTPVFWEDGIWISGVCSREFGRVLLKVDNKTNQIVDEISLPYRTSPLLYDSVHPQLVTGAGALWGFVDGRSILRFDF